MPQFLDVNVWLPLVWDGHVASEAARRWVASVDDDLVLCRVTQLSLLRHLTNPSIMGDEALTNAEASLLLQSLNARAGVIFPQEPAGLPALFPLLGESDSSTRNRWTDAYLAAFAIAGNHKLITFDQGFARYEIHGLQWELLSVS